MREIVLINITGKDKTGLTARLTEILAEYDITILDMGQAVIHDFLSLGILIEIPDEHKSSSVLKDLLFAAHKLGIHVQFTPIDEDRYESWSASRAKSGGSSPCSAARSPPGRSPKGRPCHGPERP